MNTAAIRNVPYVAAWAIWIAFLFLCLGNSVSIGLSHFDDAEMALVAQSVAHGTGYSVAPEADVAEPGQFQPGISLGPALILPCALILRLIGSREIIPGLTAILLWATLLTFLFFRVGLKVTAWHFLAGIASFVVSILALFTWHLSAWSAFLGETTAAAFLLLGHWCLAMEKFSAKWLLLSGLCLGLAVQTKTLAALGAVGALAILLFRWRYSSRPTLAQLMVWLAACLAPTLLFECWKLSELGVAGSTRTWAALLAWMKSQGLDSGSRSAFEILRERLAVLQENFLVNVFALAFLFLVPATLAVARRAQEWAWLFLGLLLSIFSLAFYWMFFSIGLPRYLLIAVALACFALTIPILGLLKLRWALLYLGLCALILAGGIMRIPATTTRLADHGLFKATSERHARKKIAHTIRELPPPSPGTPIVVGVVRRAEASAIEFNLDQKVKFQRVDSLGNLPGRKLVVINQLLGIPDQHSYIEEALHGPISSVILLAGPYELLTVDGSP